MTTPCEPFDGIPDDQEPEVMPGFEAHPFTSAPWPPLSREQVVELHDALIAWRRAEERVGPHTRAEHNARTPGNVDDRLLDVLERLGIGAPPKRTWEQVKSSLVRLPLVFASPPTGAPGPVNWTSTFSTELYPEDDTWADLGRSLPVTQLYKSLAQDYETTPRTPDESYLMPKEQGLGDPGVVEAMRAKWERMVKSPSVGKSLSSDEAPSVRPPLGFAELTLSDDDSPTVDR